MTDPRSEAARRRTFAIISHPDAGKTTLTEKFLLYGGMLTAGAGAVKAKGERTVRIYARPPPDKWEQLSALGIRHGFGDHWVRIGGLKGFVDGIMGNSSARFYEPYITSGERGSWRKMMQPAGNMERLLIGADAAGHIPQVHAIGDEAIDHLLDLFDRIEEANGPADRRLRMIHAQVLRGPEVADRMAASGVIAEVIGSSIFPRQ